MAVAPLRWLVHPEARDALEGKGPQRRLGRRLEEVAKAVGGGYCWLQMPWRPALGVGETVAGPRLGALEGGGGTFPPSNASLPEAVALSAGVYSGPGCLPFGPGFLNPCAAPRAVIFQGLRDFFQPAMLSAIHVDEYPDARRLGQHLLRLHHNAAEYEAYHMWRTDAALVSSVFLRLWNGYAANTPSRITPPPSCHAWCLYPTLIADV